MGVLAKDQVAWKVNLIQITITNVRALYTNERRGLTHGSVGVTWRALQN